MLGVTECVVADEALPGLQRYGPPGQVQSGVRLTAAEAQRLHQRYWRQFEKNSGSTYGLC